MTIKWDCHICSNHSFHFPEPSFSPISRHIHKSLARVVFKDSVRMNWPNTVLAFFPNGNIFAWMFMGKKWVQWAGLLYDYILKRHFLHHASKRKYKYVLVRTYSAEWVHQQLWERVENDLEKLSVKRGALSNTRKAFLGSTYLVFFKESIFHEITANWWWHERFHCFYKSTKKRSKLRNHEAWGVGNKPYIYFSAPIPFFAKCLYYVLVFFTTYIERELFK